MGSDKEGTGYSPEIRRQMASAQKRRSPLNDDEMWQQKESLFNSVELRLCFEKYLEEKIGIVDDNVRKFFRYLLEQSI